MEVHGHWKRFVISKTCVICGEEYFIKKAKSYKAMGLIIRPRYSKTCSRQCSRILCKRGRDYRKGGRLVHKNKAI